LNILDTIASSQNESKHTAYLGGAPQNLPPSKCVLKSHAPTTYQLASLTSSEQPFGHHTLSMKSTIENDLNQLNIKEPSAITEDIKEDETSFFVYSQNTNPL
jgi:hypothetical protein